LVTLPYCACWIAVLDQLLFSKQGSVPNFQSMKMRPGEPSAVPELRDGWKAPLAAGAWPAAAI
jgi:hypothetical protein